MSFLSRIIVTGAPGVSFSVTDGKGNIYASGPIQNNFSFTISGAIGYHTIFFLDSAGRPHERQAFLVDAQTELDDQGGQYRELVEMLYLIMANHPDCPRPTID